MTFPAFVFSLTILVTVAIVHNSNAMGKFNSKWTHGSTFHAENPDAFATKVHATGREFRPREYTASPNCEWFHAPLSVLARREGMIAYIESVLLTFALDGAQITTVHVYDGDKKIASYDWLDVQGNGQTIRTVSSWNVNRNIDGALSLSVCIKFSGDGMSMAMLIGAGAYFRYNDNM